MDISSLQCTIDKKIKKSNFDFVILRSTYGCFGTDPRFCENATALNNLEIPMGVYHTLYSDNAFDAKCEAKHCISTISKFNIEYPVCLDIEALCIEDLGKNKYFEIIEAFLNTIKNMNFYPCLFSSYESYKKNGIKKLDVDLWIRSFGKKPDNIENLCIWQYTNEGSIENWGSNINLDVSYKNYKKVIENLNMNISNGGFHKLNNMNETSIQNTTIDPQSRVDVQSSMQISTSPAGVYNNCTQEGNAVIDSKPVVYTVKPGDTLWGIAQNYLGTGQKYYEIQNLNHLTDDVIHTGQTLLIPQNPMSGWMLYNVVSGDTLWNISRKYLGSWTKYNTIMNLNNLENETIYPGQILKIPIKENSNIYVVKPGDNLWSISLKLLGDGNRYYEIINLNNLGTSPVVPGQQLKIPEF